MTILMETHVESEPPDDLERVDVGAKAAESTGTARRSPIVALTTFVLAFVSVSASAVLGSGPLFLAAAASSVIAATEVFYGNDVKPPHMN